MSESATAINVRGELANWTRQLGFMYTKDLAALSQEQFTESKGGCSRSAQSVTAEIVGFCGFTAEVVKGNNPPMNEGMFSTDELKASTATVEAAIAAINEATASLASTIEGADEALLAQEWTAPWGQPMTRFAFALIGVNHIWYHDGQLNYIQAINGDEAVHWMEQ